MEFGSRVHDDSASSSDFSNPQHHSFVGQMLLLEKDVQSADDMSWLQQNDKHLGLLLFI